jgi:hypothetical protein
MSVLLIPIELESVFERIRREENVLGSRLAELEDAIRNFEDFDRPAYESWLRLELGPQISALEELYERIREKRIFVTRIKDLVESRGLHPREALYMILEAKQGTQTASRDWQSKDWNTDEIEARRRAKRDVKRAARVQAKKDAKKNAQVAERALTRSDQDLKSQGPNAVVSLFRTLARKLHPDSPLFMKSIPPERAQTLWMEVQDAYQANHFEGLLAIAAWIDRGESREGLFESLSLSERFERVRSMNRSCLRMEKKLTQLAGHPGWGFKKTYGPDRRKLRSKAARQIEMELDQAQEGLVALEEFIESMGTPRAPKKEFGRRR